MKTSSRQLVLERIRKAGSTAPKIAYEEIERNYTRTGKLDSGPKLRLLVERLREYDAEVVECTPEELVDTIAAQLLSSHRQKFVAPEEIPAKWLASGIHRSEDLKLTTADLNEIEGVLTAAFCAIADSGTIVLHHSETEGRRALSLLPDFHLCVLYASQVVETLPEYFARCAEPPRLATYISGPSATADIEMTRIKGVHGPRFLHVILVHDETSAA